MPGAALSIITRSVNDRCVVGKLELSIIVPRELLWIAGGIVWLDWSQVPSKFEKGQKVPIRYHANYVSLITLSDPIFLDAKVLSNFVGLAPFLPKLEILC